jgi:hypothetical protein
MKIKRILFLFILVLVANDLMAQKGLLEILDEEQQDLPQYTLATFKATRISYGHSIETRKKGILEVSVANRFWNTPSLYSQSFGADKMNARIALEYGISDRFSTGFGGSTWDGLFDGYLKYRLVRQRNDTEGSPFSITLFQNASYYSEGITAPNMEDSFSGRLSFTSQALIARKFTPDFSFQIAPTFVHKGMRYSEEDPMNHFAIGFGGRYKLGGHLSLVSEYYTVFNPKKSYDTYGPFSIGLNWELGDVMLQFMLTNASHIVEDAFITGTNYNFNFKNPNLNFGFNATYVIHFNRKLKSLKQVNK